MLWRHSANATDVDGPRNAIERRTDMRQRLPLPQIGRSVYERPDVIHVLAGRQALKELDDMRGPAGHVTCQLLQHRGRAFAAAIGDRMRDLGAARDDGGDDAVQWAIANQIADVRDRPFGAGFDDASS